MDKNNKNSLLAFAFYVLLMFGADVQGQGTVTFNGHAGLSSSYYEELGLWFQASGADGMAIVSPGSANLPQNSSAYMIWYRQLNPFNYVSLSMADGSLFGLTSVQLADPTAPSSSLLPITFLGFRSDGSTVSQTFTTPGGGANSFLTYQFGPEFASGLLSVRIDAPRWAMDNLVWIPEPSTYALLGLGLLALAWQRFHQRRKS